jgi:ribosomal protein S27E
VTSPVILKLVCAWCTRVLREGTPGAHTSHGMCPGCSARFDQEVVFGHALTR